jgi:hypothetical protein
MGMEILAVDEMIVIPPIDAGGGGPGQARAAAYACL